LASAILRIEANKGSSSARTKTRYQKSRQAQIEDLRKECGLPARTARAMVISLAAVPLALALRKVKLGMPS
jgi:hypothetical protein